MKRTILLLSAILFVADGCVKTEISDHLGTPTIIRLHQAIAVIPYPLTKNLRIDSYWYPHWRSQTEVADCLVNSMKSVEPKLKFIERDSFRDALYPWFAPSTAPKNLEELASVMKNPLVKERMSNFGVRFVILVTGYTIERDFIGAGIYIFGYTSLVRETKMSVIVWDEEELLSLGDIEVLKSGRVRYIGIWPFTIPAFTEGPVCNEVGEKLIRILTGRTSQNKKLIESND